jgi:RNA polymerase sigma factor (sigma-70 family)
VSTDFGIGSAENQGMFEGPGAADRHPLAHVYDTYGEHLYDYCAGVLQNPATAADAVQDTLIAADTQINKLRNYDRLRVWLYCIAHRQCMGLLADRAEMTASDQLGGEYPRTAGRGTRSQSPAQGSETDTLLVVTAALDGLSESDREVLNLVFRHGIDGEDLAAVFSVSPVQARALVSGASARFEKAASVVVTLSRGWTSCPELEGIVGFWDPASPQLTPTLLDRLTEHIDSCDTCGPNRNYTAFGPDLLGTVPLLIPPAMLRRQITNAALDPEAESYRSFVVDRLGPLDNDGFPVQPRARRGLALVIAASAAALLVLVAGGALLYQHTFAASPASSSAAAGVAAAPGTSTDSAPASSAPAGTSPAAPPATTPPAGLFPLPGSNPPVPLPPPPVPTPTPPRHSASPTPSPPHHTKSPHPTPSPTTPTPTPTTPTPTPTTPTPTPTTPTPTPTTPTPGP